MQRQSCYIFLFTGLFLCLLQGEGVSSSCDDIRGIDFAEITYEPEGFTTHPEGTNATIVCAIFYEIVPADFGGTTCINGSWTGAMPRCRHIHRQCRRNDNLVQIYGRDCEIRCRNRLEGACPRNKRCYCDGVCGWSCIAIYEDNFCPEVSEQEGILVSYNPPERRFNGYANFSCSEGYRYHSGISKRRCMSNRQWGGGREYVCIPDVVCGDPPVVDNASLDPSSRHFFVPGDRRSYTCDRGYTIFGSREITCGDDYEWYQPQFSCTPRSCGFPGTISNAELTTRRFQFKDKAIYVCHEGYENPPYTPSYRTCQADGQWSYFMPVCEPVRCPEMGSLEHGEVESWGNTFGSHITFHCNDGYRLEGSSRRECQGDKTWSGEETVCVEIICEDPGVPNNGHRTNEKAVYRLNDVLYFGCDDGYTRDGSVSNYCTESGQWAHPLPFCGGNCVVPPRPRNGWLRNGYQYPTRGTIVRHATRLEVRCSARLGFTPRERSIRCNNGVWSDSDNVKPLCKGTPCGVRYNSPNLIVTYDPQVEEEDRNNNLIPHDTRVYYTCERGYTRIGVTEARCNRGSYGRNSVPLCNPVECPRVDVSHGRFTYHPHDGSSKHSTPVHTDIRRLECHSGYKTSDFNRSYCDNGRWINEGAESVSCLPRPCDPISEIPGTASYLTNGPQRTDQKYNNGTVVYVSCFSDYAPAIGNGTAVCIASKWRPANPACVQASNLLINANTSQTPNMKALRSNSYLARDGNKASDPRFCSRTERVFNPWWKAEITCTIQITAVKIYNRLDRRRYDLLGAEIRIGMEEDYTKNFACGGPITRTQIDRSTEQNHGFVVNCPGGGNHTIGRIISVHIPANEKRELSLCEVEVFSLGEPFSVNSRRTCPREESQVACVVPRVENGEIHTAEITGGQVVLAGTEVRLGCKSGYKLRENSTDGIVILRCLGNSSWDTPVCEPKPCTVQRLNNGGFPGRKINYDDGENITFSCFLGFEKPHESYWCDKGSARPAMPQCIQASCDVPNLPDHMVASQLRYDHGLFLNVSCQHGFQFSANQQSLRCWRGVWSRSLDVICLRVSCPQPGRDTHSTVEPLNVPGIYGYVHGARIRYSCSDGYEIEGNAERECDNGHWTGQEPQCRRPAPPRCMLPERSNGEQYYVLGYIGNIFDEGLPVGERADISVRCNPGFIPQREVSARCLDGGVWSDTVPICVKMERLCPKPGYISHVVQYVNGLDVNNLANYPHDELPEGTFLISRCSLPGQYVLQGSTNRTCSDGRWMGEEPRCIASETKITFQNNPPLETWSNGTIVIYPRSILHIHCNMPRGSRRDAHFSSTSGVTGTYWNRRISSQMSMTLNPPNTSHSGNFTCRSYYGILSHSVSIQFAEINCSRPNVPANGKLHDFDYGWKNGSYYMGKVVSYTCNSGYRLDGERRITCVLGQWSDRVPRCRRTTCPELQPPAHGSKRGGNRVGESVLIGCNYGYQLQGEPFLDCLESGEWSHPLPNCTEIVRPCDLVDCEVWQKCVIDSSNVAVCQCISPHDCPASEEPRVCGSDGVYYTSLCHLKAKACLWDSGVDVASSEQYCVDGIPEYTLAPPTVPHFEPGELSSSSSFQSTYPVVDPDESSILEPTLSADIGPAEPDSSPTTQQEVDVDPSSYQFCHGGVCPSGWTAEMWRNSTAVIIAYADEWQADLSILTIRIYEVMSGELQHWTKDSQQEVLIDDSGVVERGCICPSFQLPDPVIIPFSQDLRSDGKGKLKGTDIVLPYSQYLYHEILNLLQEPPAPQETDQPEVDIGSSSSSSFGTSEENQESSPSSIDSDVNPTTINTESIDPTPGPSESSFDT